VGLLRRHPELKLRFEIGRVAELVDLQRLL
jgi:hypothetical protein